MINAEFFSLPTGELIGYRIKGHSDMAESGQDILCAFVSSAAILTANTISEVIKAKADIYDDDGEVYVMIKRSDAVLCKDILEGGLHYFLLMFIKIRDLFVVIFLNLLLEFRI